MALVAALVVMLQVVVVRVGKGVRGLVGRLGQQDVRGLVLVALSSGGDGRHGGHGRLGARAFI